VIFYRETYREEAARERLARLCTLLRAGDITSLLVEAGEVEQGVVDSLSPRADGWGPVERQLRAMVLAAGRTYVAALDQTTGVPAPGRREAAAPYLERVGEELAALEHVPLPPTIHIRPPEGYVHYALNPAGYVAAARCYVRDVGVERAARALVVGVRSIGTSLSAAVAAAVGSDRTITVRPRGETGGRRVVAGEDLARYAESLLAGGGDALIVDEGPGATGETLARVAQWLERVGAAPERIVVFPSRTWGMPLAPSERQAWFARAWKYGPSDDCARPAHIAAQIGLVDLVDHSAGRWRQAIPGAAGEVANPGHERTKYLSRDARGTGYQLRYAGLGSWGAAAVVRAEALAEAGIGPAVAGNAQGFLAVSWSEGRPVTRDAARDSRFLAALETYLGRRAPLFRTGEPTHIAPIVAMLRANAGEALGHGAPGLAAALHRLERLPEREGVIPDARLHPREWVRVERAGESPATFTTPAYIKVDAIDHGAGLRLPGPTDLAWDIAGSAVEFGLTPETVERLIAHCASAVHDRSGALADAVAAYRPPYVACALGEALLASWEATNDHDRRLLAAESARYRALLERELLAAES